MSAFIWLTIKMTKDFTVDVQIPIELIQSDSMSYIEKPVEFINYKVSGSGWDLLAMKSQKQFYKDTLVYKLDESSQITIPKRRILSFLEDKLSHLQIISTSPETFTIKQARAYVKKVPVIVPIAINLEEGYALTENISIQPDSIFIKGPIKEIKPITSWRTDSIFTDKLSENKEMRVKVKKPATPVVSISPQFINVKLSVEQYTEQSFYIPIQLKNSFNDGISIFPSRIQIKFKVPISQYETVKPEHFKAIVNFNHRISNTNNLLIEINERPSYIKEVGFNPKIVEFFYTDESQTE